MTDPAPPSPTVTGRDGHSLANGDWQRLHPATPLLRGGIGMLAVIGILAANLRDQLLRIFLPVPGEPSIIELIVEQRLVPWVILGLIAVLAVSVGGFTLSWRMASFRVTADAVEVRRGVLVRSNRQTRLDRIQGVSVNRPLLARLFGAAKLDIDVAGQGSGVSLSYLRTADAEQLRRDLLTIASGRQRASAGENMSDAVSGPHGGPHGDPATGHHGMLHDRLTDLRTLGDAYSDVPQPSLVVLPLGRIIGSIALSGLLVWFIIGLAIGIWFVAAGRGILAASVLIPFALALSSFVFNRLAKSVNYHIAETPDGVRVGSGLLSLTSETMPPGRIHAIEVTQPLLWRLTGWWEVRANRASSARPDPSNRGTQPGTILPVGTTAEMERVLGLLLTGLLGRAGDRGRAGDADDPLGATLRAGILGGPGYTTAPKTARALHPLSWRRRGIAVDDRAIYLRRGRFSRSLTIIPLARLQSEAASQGPIERSLGLATIHPHTVAGPIGTRFDALAADDVRRLFETLAEGAVAAAATDRSHRWADGAAR